ncbi:MAG: hypothetical protein GTN69_12345 [Armatimonadetes bacterium]|nr:hypothetical protein [Armatimonadota bacterium]
MSNEITKESIERQAKVTAEKLASKYEEAVSVWRGQVSSGTASYFLVSDVGPVVRADYQARSLREMLRCDHGESMESAVAYLRARLTKDLLSNADWWGSTDPFTCAVAEAIREAKSDLLNSDLAQIEAILALRDQVEG